MSHNTASPDNGAMLPTTAKLMKMLESSPSQFREQQLPVVNAPAFHEYLYQLMKRQNISAPSIIANASISKTYAYQFLNGERLPGRDIILRISLVLGLKIEETQRLLTLAGKNILYPKIRRDGGILYCIRKKMTLNETNVFLEELGEPPLL